ncbi:MAG: molybdopterin-dependent oxidoreductase [Hyphomicrobiales bacterium]|nr:molybdopterin-dependent oxidoreductase [Hyphomicrobiales bacterium]
MSTIKESTGSAGESRWLGSRVERIEDATLLAGRGYYTDDLPVRAGTLHAAILRSPHAHAEIISIDASAATNRPGVVAVLTGREIKEDSDPFLIVLRQPMDQWSLAVDRVRFVGEAVAVVIAENRYIAEDAADDIKVQYKKLPAVIDPLAALEKDAPLVHAAVGSNVPSDRHFTYGDPDRCFAEADKVVSITIDYPRNSQTPLEGYVVVADYQAGEGVYDVLCNFQGPFTVHPVMSKALRCQGAQLRIRTPAYSGGGFGVKQAIFPYVVLMCIASKRIGRPVKWVEDRFEHLTAAIAAPNRIIHAQAAAKNDGTVTALRFEQIDDYGAYLRPPMPGPLYRQHGIMTGAYGVKNMSITNKLVMTNKTPSGMVRGFGGPQIYYALERLMQRVAVELGLDPLDVIRRNLIPAGSFPYRAPAGALIDSGDYQTAIAKAERDGGLAELRRRRDEARAQGRLYGIGFAVVVEPAQSNMGYLSTIVPVEERKKAGPKGGNVAYATVHVDCLGTVSVTADSLPQGQGHATVLSQIVADQLGLNPYDIRCNMERDTQRDPWSIATGNYSSRFSSSTAVAAQLAAIKVRSKLAQIASQTLNVAADEIAFGDGKVFSTGNPDNAIRFSRLAGTAHWSPGELPMGMAPGISETASYSAPELEPPNDADQINTSLTYGFVFDFCGVEVDRDTGSVRIDKYVTMHDSGKLLNPLLAEGQVLGSFGWGIGCALYEEFVYSPDGSFLSGTFADYLCPTACEVPRPTILHMESPSPLSPLGAKGIAEGNCMSTPVCIANAVADALGVKEVKLPLTRPRIKALMGDTEKPPRTSRPTAVAPAASAAPSARPGAKTVTGSGSLVVPAAQEAVWNALLDPKVLARTIPGCHSLDQVAPNDYRAEVSLGVGVIKGRFTARVKLSELDPPNAATLSGGLEGPLGISAGGGRVRFSPEGHGTRIDYDYAVEISGKVAAVGARMLDGATKVLIGQFFHRLTAELGAGESPKSSWWRRILKALGF